jgi:nitrogen fixation protein NifB
VSHVTLTVNAVRPETGAKIYAWIRDGKRIHRGLAGAELLWDRQSLAIQKLKSYGITVKINTIIIPGVNDEHVLEVAQRVAELGADIANCVPLYPVEGTEFAGVVPPTHDRVVTIRSEVGRYLPIMEHCTRCRADAMGLLGEAMPARVELALLAAAGTPAESTGDRPCVAVATREGMLVNQHLGEAERLAIFRQGERGFELVEIRPTPPSGGGRGRWLALAESLRDCHALLVASAGEAPRSVLAEQGIKVIFMEGLIEEGLDATYRGVDIRAPLRRQHRCGSGCAGGGLGCM